MSYYPGHTGDDVKSFALSRKEVRSLLSLVVGGPSDPDMANVLMRLTAELG